MSAIKKVIDACWVGLKYNVKPGVDADDLIPAELELAALQARVATLEGALQPFALAWEGWASVPEDLREPHPFAFSAEFQRAAAALRGK